MRMVIEVVIKQALKCKPSAHNSRCVSVRCLPHEHIRYRYRYILLCMVRMRTTIYIGNPLCEKYTENSKGYPEQQESWGRKARYVTFVYIPGSVWHPVRFFNPVLSKERALDRCNGAGGYCGKQMMPKRSILVS